MTATQHNHLVLPFRLTMSEPTKTHSHPQAVLQSTFNMASLRDATARAQARLTQAGAQYSEVDCKCKAYSKAAKKDREARDETMRAALDVSGVTAQMHNDLKTASEKYLRTYLSWTEAEKELRKRERELDSARSSWRRANDAENRYEEQAQKRRQLCAKKAVDKFFEKADAAFVDYTSLRSFPKPPASPCGKKACEMKEGRALEACECNIRTTFKGRANLKVERLRWHPDKFGQCPEDVREKFRKMASEIFVVLDGMYKEQQKQQQQQQQA